MKSLTISRYGGPEVLELRESPDPTAAAGEVLVEVSHAGLNFADITARVGLYPDAPKPPMVMGYEVAGRVKSVGPNVRSVHPGDAVLAVTQFRGQASAVSVPEGQLFKIPKGMSREQAAALPVNYLTAFHMLHEVARVKPFDKVLIHMAAGGVGLAAIQLCRLVEGVEIFGTASEAKHPMLRDAGVAYPIDYRKVDYAEEVRRRTGGKGVQLVLDPLGGRDWEKGYNLLAPTGQLIAFGWSNMVSSHRRSWLHVLSELISAKRYSPMSLMEENRTVSGVNMGRLWNLEDLMRRDMEKLLSLFQQKKISPLVDRVFPLSAGADAHRYIQERRNVGKVLFDCAA
jgi:NADPH:quinone reductase-like Zn-dependent oxidoreductase